MNKTLIIGVAALAVTLTACGDYGAGAEVTPTTPTTEHVRRVVEYRNRDIEVTPDACLTALDIAQDVFDIFVDVAGAASDGFYAAADFDVAGIEAAGRAFRQATADLDPLIPRWHTARDDCKAAS